MRTVFKQLLVVSLLMTALVACGTTPVSLPVTKIIGAEGGTVSSTDGSITLDIPAGTFSSPTTVGLESTTSSDAPWGEANGWRLTGLGIQMKAVGVKFKYSGESPIEWSSVAMQDEAKAWFGFNSTVVNKAEKTISVTFPAQTSPGNVVALNSRVQVRDSTEKRIYIYRDWVFKPLKATIKVKAVLKMSLEICRPKYSANDNKLVSINNIEKDCIPKVSSAVPIHVYVNGIEYGNSTVGAVVTVIDPSNDGESYEYIAPPKIPFLNPVEISVIVPVSKQVEKVFNSFVTIEPACFPSGNLIQSSVSITSSTCVDLWDGTITTTIKRSQPSLNFSLDSTVTSRVIFEVDNTKTPMSGFAYYRLKSGTYDYKVTSTLRDCTTTITSSGSLPTGVDINLPNYTASNLVLDTSLDPQTYLGGGISLIANVTTTTKCSSPPREETKVGSEFLSWWLMVGDYQKASVDGTTLQGSGESRDDQIGATVRSDWLFTRRSQ